MSVIESFQLECPLKEDPRLLVVLVMILEIELVRPKRLLLGDSTASLSRKSPENDEFSSSDEGASRGDATSVMVE